MTTSNIVAVLLPCDVCMSAPCLTPGFCAACRTAEARIRRHAKNQNDKHPRRPKQADILIGLAKSAKLFHAPAPNADAYADIMIDGHRETHRVRGAGFRRWLRHQFFKQTGSGCNSEAMQTAIETIAAMAQFEGKECAVHIRIAKHGDAIYIDFGDPDWTAIEVTEIGWKVIEEVPVRFVRTASTKALPVPQRGSSIELFRPFCNLKTDDEFVVLVGHVLATLRPDANYPVLVTTGEQGSCKSTLFRLIVRLVDPRSPELRSLPKDEDDLITGAKGAHALSFDNISGIPVWLSDAICRLATGGGAGKRKLYSDEDEILFDGRRPTFLNGIEDVVTRGDLVERSNIFSLEVIAENKRRTEAEIDAEFGRRAPEILGALLDGLVAGLKNLSSVEIGERPRMADVALWAEACTRAYWPANTFIRAYRKNLAASVELVLEASTVGTAVRRFMEAREEWKGTAQELLGLLTPQVGEQISKERDWPKRPNTLSGKLKRAASALRKIGVHVTLGRRAGHAGERMLTIEKRGRPDYRPETSSALSAPSAKPSRSSKIDSVSADYAGDRPARADDDATSADNPLTIAGKTIVSVSPLQNNGSDNADGADDLSEQQSGSARGNSNQGDDTAGKRCAQCCGLPDGRERHRAIGNRLVLLHDECLRFYRAEQPGSDDDVTIASSFGATRCHRDQSP